MTVNMPHHRPSATARKARESFVVAICIIWVVASAIGFAVEAFAATPSGLRGAQTSLPTPTKAQVTRATRSAPKTSKASGTPKTGTSTVATPQAWLGSSIWRAGPCDSASNFQTFSFTSAPKVEVGSGKPGEGERLELLRISTDPTGLIQVETRVCAPVGCNQTIERYKKLGADQMQEWHFEGRLPNITPYVIVANGAALDGSGPGRVFNRCAA